MEVVAKLKRVQLYWATRYIDFSLYLPCFFNVFSVHYASLCMEQLLLVY